MGNRAGVAGHNLGGCHHRPLSEKTKAGDEDEQSSQSSEPGGAAKNQRFGTKLFTDRRKMRPMLLVQQFDLHIKTTKSVYMNFVLQGFQWYSRIISYHEQDIHYERPRHSFWHRQPGYIIVNEGLSRKGRGPKYKSIAQNIASSLHVHIYCLCFC